MHRDICLLFEQRNFEFLDEQALAPSCLQGYVEDAVAGRCEPNELGFNTRV